MAHATGGTLRRVRELTRWDEWATSKMPLIFACIGYALLKRPAPLAQPAALALVLCLYAMFGYMVNAWSDRAVDRAAGKASALADLPGPAAGLLVGAVLLAGIASSFLLFGDRPDVLWLMLLAFGAAAAYSLPPLRFKERGFAGLAVSAIAQRALPAAIVFQALRAWDAAAIVLCLLGGLVGLRYIVVHQIADAAADTATGVRTVATSRGVPFLRSLQTRVLFPLEVLALVGAVALVSIEAPAIAAASAAFAAWSALQYKLLPAERAARFSPVSYGVFADFYNFFLPAVMSLVVALRHPDSWPVAVFTAVWLASEFRRESAIVRRVAGRLA